MKEKIKNLFYRRWTVTFLKVLTVLFCIAGIAVGAYFNFMWFIETVANFVNHIQESPIDGTKVAYDVGRFCLRGLVFLVSMAVLQIPWFFLSLLKDHVRFQVRKDE